MHFIMSSHETAAVTAAVTRYAMTVPAITLIIVFCIFLQAENVEITIVFAL